MIRRIKKYIESDEAKKLHQWIRNSYSLIFCTFPIIYYLSPIVFQIFCDSIINTFTYIVDYIINLTKK